jgi:hypothetical protein
MKRQHKAATIEINKTSEGFEITVTLWNGNQIHDFTYTQKKAFELAKQYANS